MGKMDKDIKRILVRFAVSVVVACILMLGMRVYANRLSNKVQSVELGSETGDYRFDYQISKRWGEAAHGHEYGMQCDLEVENNTKAAMLDWEIRLHMTEDCYLDSFWNGEFMLDGDDIIITCVDFNDTIEPGEMQPFGMVVHSDAEDCIVSGQMQYRVHRSIRELPLFWIVILVMLVMVISTINGLIYTAKNLRIKQKERDAFKIINQSFLTFANTIDAKDSYTKGHSQRVAYYARELSKRMGCDEDFQRNIFYAGLLHDIGKIGVQDAILKKSTKLTYDEFNEIKEHVTMGGDILNNFSAIEGIKDVARYHHERYDGSGYMEGRSGADIPIMARITSVADAFDAMSSARCYRAALSMKEIVGELTKCAGKQFDPEIIPHMIDMINDGVAPVNLEDTHLEDEFGIY